MDRLSSMMIWQKAAQFYEAAKVLCGQGRAVFSPTYFVAGQAIELALKGFHRGHGASEGYLKKALGHDLSEALSTAEDKGLSDIVPISPEDRAYVAALNDYYLTKDLQYAKQGSKSWPHIDGVLAVADKLVNGLRGYCEAKREVHDGKPTAVQ